MKQYKVFKHPSGAIEAVKQGWSWPAFFFSFIWAMVKKMWALGVGFFAAFFILGIILGIILGLAGVKENAANGLINIAAIIANSVFGVNGNAWREKNLLSRGFEFRDTVTAANPDGAMALILKSDQAPTS
ncbi:MAG: DUF2628 domain-containing protein [Smithella sp.]